MNQTTACPLDCYDACEIIIQDEKITAHKRGYTSGFLCPHLNHYNSHNTIQSPRYKGEKVSLEKALSLLKDMLTSSKKENLLHYKGNGNFGLMQDSMEHFFASYGATLTDGTLCDGAGEAGIIHGRGSNKNMPLSEIRKAEVVVIWGRNPHTTSSHLLPLLKDKTIIVIDPLQTKIAKRADLFIQIKPHGDLKFAMLVYRILYEQGLIKQKTSNHKKYYTLMQTLNMENILLEIDVTYEEILSFITLVKTKKVAFVCGIGIQKYKDGADVLRAIDTLAVGLDLFSKEGSGVAYLGNSKEAISTPFNLKAFRVSKVNTEFSDFETVFIQGSNPVSQMPDSMRVRKSLENVENLVYFGLYENETSEMADLIIPAKSFLLKNDIRTSYSHNFMMQMPQVRRSAIGISEYDLSAYLCNAFEINLESEAYYLNHFKSFSIKNDDGALFVKNRKSIPYQNGFDTEDGEFHYLDKFCDTFTRDDTLFLLTPKSAKSLNSQFKREKNVYINTSHGFSDGDILIVSSSIGSVILVAKIDSMLRDDCVLIYSGTAGVNNLTSSIHSDAGKCAVFQEEKITLCKS